LRVYGYCKFYPFEPITTSPKVFPIIYPANKIVKQGDHIVYQFKYNKTTDIMPVVQRQFVDGIVFNVAGLQTSAATTKGAGIAQVEIDIPETLPPGKYYLRIGTMYQINPIRRLYYIYMTEKFEVVVGNNHVDSKQDTIQDAGDK
jgi:hypothetical protein